MIIKEVTVIPLHLPIEKVPHRVLVRRNEGKRRIRAVVDEVMLINLLVHRIGVPVAKLKIVSCMTHWAWNRIRPNKRSESSIIRNHCDCIQIKIRRTCRRLRIKSLGS